MDSMVHAIPTSRNEKLSKAAIRKHEPHLTEEHFQKRYNENARIMDGLIRDGYHHKHLRHNFIPTQDEPWPKCGGNVLLRKRSMSRSVS